MINIKFLSLLDMTHHTWCKRYWSLW